jgi:hypothetical protein
VHLPEASLKRGGFGGARGLQRMTVHGQRQMAEDDAQQRTVFSLYLLQFGVKTSARRALEIAELF